MAAGFGGARATYWNTLAFPLVVVRRKLFSAPRGGSDVHLYSAPVETAFDAANLGLARSYRQMKEVMGAATLNTGNVNQATGSFTFNGTNLNPPITGFGFGTHVVLSSGTFTITSVTNTSITVNFSVAPSLGPLTAVEFR